jgi:hypothetical protein
MAEKDGPVELIYGGVAGLVASGILLIPKSIADVVIWLSGGDTRPARIIKGLIDLALGGYAAWDVLTHPKDDFWKAATWVFAVFEIVYGGLSTSTAIVDYVTGKVSGESLDLKVEKHLLEFLTGKKYEK